MVEHWHVNYFSHNTAFSSLWWTATDPWFSAANIHCLCAAVQAIHFFPSITMETSAFYHCIHQVFRMKWKWQTHMLSSTCPLLWSMICVDPKHQYVDQSYGKSTIISVHSNLVYRSSSWTAQHTKQTLNKTRTRTKMSESIYQIPTIRILKKCETTLCRLTISMSIFDKTEAITMWDSS